MPHCENIHNCVASTDACAKISKPFFMETPKPCYKPPESATPTGQVDSVVSVPRVHYEIFLNNVKDYTEATECTCAGVTMCWKCVFEKDIAFLRAH